jgi:hypothetical protein
MPQAQQLPSPKPIRMHVPVVTHATLPIMQIQQAQVPLPAKQTQVPPQSAPIQAPLSQHQATTKNDEDDDEFIERDTYIPTASPLQPFNWLCDMCIAYYQNNPEVKPEINQNAKENQSNQSKSKSEIY